MLITSTSFFYFSFEKKCLEEKVPSNCTNGVLWSRVMGDERC